MRLTRYRSSDEQEHDDEQSPTQKRRAVKKIEQTGNLARKLIESTDTVKMGSVAEAQERVVS